MKAIVHIGQPKTGTSTIQSFLARNARRLVDRGIRYNRIFPDRGSQFEFVFAALNRIGELPLDAAEQAYYGVRGLEELGRTAVRPKRVLRRYPERFDEPVAVFSSEHFAPWIRTVDAVRETDAMFRETFEDVRYILYLRNPLTLCVSRYSETIKRGRSHSFEAFLQNQARVPSLYEVAARWREGVGQDRLDVRLLERDWLRAGDLLEDFCVAIGVEMDGLVVPKRVNEGLNQLGIECMRVLNRAIPPSGASDVRRKDLVQMVGQFSEGAPALRPTSEQLDRVASANSATNEKLRAEFFPDRKVLFAPPPEASGALSPGELAERVQEVLVRIISRQHERGLTPSTDSEKAEGSGAAPVAVALEGAGPPST